MTLAGFLDNNDPCKGRNSFILASTMVRDKELISPQVVPLLSFPNLCGPHLLAVFFPSPINLSFPQLLLQPCASLFSFPIFPFSAHYKLVTQCHFIRFFIQSFSLQFLFYKQMLKITFYQKYYCLFSQTTSLHNFIYYLLE